MQPTALVNEAYLRLAGSRQLAWEGRLQFFAYAATTMRRILVNHLRDQRAAKRGGLGVAISLEEIFEVPAPPGASGGDLLDLEAALVELEEVDPRQARIVELRYFGGLSVEETAEARSSCRRARSSGSGIRRAFSCCEPWALRDAQAADPLPRRYTRLFQRIRRIRSRS